MENNTAFSKEDSLSIFQTIQATVPQQQQSEFKNLYRLVDYQNYSPVKRFEEASGLQGIYYNYKFPNNIDPLEYEELMKPMRIYEVLERGAATISDELATALKETQRQSLFAIRHMHNDLIELNPELKKAETVSTHIRSYVAIISGACSGFPPEDIIEFSQAKGEDNDRINKEKYEFSQQLETRLKLHKTNNQALIENWCPSRKTRDMIMQKLNEREREREQKQKKQEQKLNTPFENSDFYSFLADRGWFND